MAGAKYMYIDESTMCCAVNLLAIKSVSIRHQLSRYIHWKFPPHTFAPYYYYYSNVKIANDTMLRLRLGLE